MASTLHTTTFPRTGGTVRGEVLEVFADQANTYRTLRVTEVLAPCADIDGFPGSWLTPRVGDVVTAIEPRH